MANAAVMGNTPFLWEGTDRKGNKIKGKSMAADEAAVRAAPADRRIRAFGIQVNPYLSVGALQAQITAGTVLGAPIDLYGNDEGFPAPLGPHRALCERNPCHRPRGR